ncbi:MAG: hypothetical protein JXB62_13200 [Pirellulales bacterium]|nr:hypothetical protein [Pirellulales bacterium]
MSSTPLPAARRAFRRLAQHRAAAVCCVGLVALALGVGFSFACPRQPAVHDEFSYLLAADTFAHGRVANPTHPMWRHFETFHVIQEPSYVSMYPPSQGLFLAAGQVATGHAIVGVWLSFALAAAAVCWMLQAWMPPGWAMLGGLLAAAHAEILQWWATTYWGGAVAMLGGALVFGALRRIVRFVRVRDALWLGVGLAVLANSRPFTGLVLSLPVAVVLLAWMLGKHGPSLSVSLRQVVLPILGVLGLTVAAMVYYNLRTTGEPLVRPYVLAWKTYSVTPIFLWQDGLPEPTYRHDVIRQYHLDWAREVFESHRSPRGIARECVRRLTVLWHFYLGFALLIPLAVLLCVANNRWIQLALLSCGLVVLALLQPVWLCPHYAAPATALVFLLGVQGLRHLRLWRPEGLPLGRYLVPILLLCYFAAPAVMVVRYWTTGHDPWHHYRPWSNHRAEILADLRADGDRHLVIVRYGPEHWFGEEWVYNEADIDGAAVVWAREMGPEQDRELIDYFGDRRVWLLEADSTPPTRTPYPLRRPAGTSSRADAAASGA